MTEPSKEQMIEWLEKLCRYNTQPPTHWRQSDFDYKAAILAHLRREDGRDGWQPIESAPMDGSFVFMYWPTMSITRYPVVGFHNGDEYGWALTDRDYGEVMPTHWHSIPATPAAPSDVPKEAGAEEVVELKCKHNVLLWARCKDCEDAGGMKCKHWCATCNNKQWLFDANGMMTKPCPDCQPAPQPADVGIPFKLPVHRTHVYVLDKDGAMVATAFDRASADAIVQALNGMSQVMPDDLRTYVRLHLEDANDGNYQWEIERKRWLAWLCTGRAAQVNAHQPEGVDADALISDFEHAVRVEARQHDKYTVAELAETRAALRTALSGGK